MTTSHPGVQQDTGMGHRLLVVLPLLLLLAVASIHSVLRHTTELSAWKGGGFAMFSTVDGPSIRQVRISIQNVDGVWISALAPAAYSEDLGQLRAVSSESLTEAVASRAAADSWFTAGGDVAFVSNDASGDRPGFNPVAVQRVRVEVLHPRFDAESGDLTLQTIHDIQLIKENGTSP